VKPPYEVFVNGIPQTEGVDFDVIGNSLIFRRTLAREGKLGFWRWLSMFLGVAGTYRKNDSVSVVYTLDDRKSVVMLAPVEV